jgi:hypothetical protein
MGFKMEQTAVDPSVQTSKASIALEPGPLMETASAPEPLSLKGTAKLGSSS